MIYVIMSDRQQNEWGTEMLWQISSVLPDDIQSWKQRQEYMKLQFKGKSRGNLKACEKKKNKTRFVGIWLVIHYIHLLSDGQREGGGSGKDVVIKELANTSWDVCVCGGGRGARNTFASLAIFYFALMASASADWFLSTCSAVEAAKANHFSLTMVWYMSDYRWRCYEGMDHLNVNYIMMMNKQCLLKVQRYYRRNYIWKFAILKTISMIEFQVSYFVLHLNYSKDTVIWQKVSL